MQRDVADKHLPSRVTVVTGNSGSYKEHDILNLCEAHHGKWRPGVSRWELFFLDAYAPGLTDNVQRACWQRGKILVTHGGGASAVCQTNDTDLHLWVRKKFMELQQELMVRKSRKAGGCMVDLTREENIDVMIEVMSDAELHLQASRGYLYTGTMVPLDGSGDHHICREAGIFWNEQNMRTRINSAVADVEAKFHAGHLPWTWAIVQGLISPFPKRGHLDEVLPGQEDEATRDPDRVPWQTEEAQKEDEEDAEPLANMECTFDPSDWHESSFKSDAATLGHSAPRGDGECLTAAASNDGNDLTEEQCTVLSNQSARMKNLNATR